MTAPEKPIIDYNVKGDIWTVREEYIDPDVCVKIPKGFKTDLASIPRILWAIWPNYSLSERAPLIHDYLYRFAGTTVTTYHPVFKMMISQRAFPKSTADKIFRAIMKDEGVKRWKRNIAYYAVKFFAGGVWKKHREKNLAKK